jgi:hypothetical protein
LKETSERQTDKKKERKTNRQTDTQTYIQTKRKKDMLTGRWTLGNKRMYRQIGQVEIK